MNKAQLVNGIIKKTSGSVYRRDIEKVLDAFTEVVEEALKEGDKVQLIGFGSFEPVDRKERKARNPRTGKECIVPATKSVRFSVGKKLRDFVNS